MRRAGRVAPRGARRGIYRIFVENRKGRGLVEYLDMNEGIILKWVLKISVLGAWTGLMWLMTRNSDRLL
jgi:hypothetical protein